jgi:hypothetical protein
MTKNELIDYTDLSNLPNYILNDAEYKDDFKLFFQNKNSDIYADIESLYLNPNCSCANKIKKYVIENKSKVVDTIFDFFKSDTIQVNNLIKKYENTQLKTLSGKVLKTKFSEWKSFYLEINNYQFKSFSVVKEGEDLYVFFL